MAIEGGEGSRDRRAGEELQELGSLNEYPRLACTGHRVDDAIALAVENEVEDCLLIG